LEGIRGYTPYTWIPILGFMRMPLRKFVYHRYTLINHSNIVGIRKLLIFHHHRLSMIHTSQTRTDRHRTVPFKYTILIIVPIPTFSLQHRKVTTQVFLFPLFLYFKFKICLKIFVTMHKDILGL
jgi:hypothetical protein